MSTLVTTAWKYWSMPKVRKRLRTRLRRSRVGEHGEFQTLHIQFRQSFRHAVEERPLLDFGGLRRAKSHTCWAASSAS